MLRDMSHAKPTDDAIAIPETASQLRNLGWGAYFWDQVDAAEFEQSPPVRITQVHRHPLHTHAPQLELITPAPTDAPYGT